MNLQIYGYTGFYEAQAAQHPDLLPARVAAVHRERYDLVCAHGEVSARLAGAAYYQAGTDMPYPTAGDFVLIRHNPDGESAIVKTLERRSKFSRTDFSGHMQGYAKTILEQVVAANFDYVFIMSSLNQDFRVGRIERYLAAAWQSGAVPAIILTKADLAGDCSEQLRAVERIAPGVGVYAISAHTGQGLAELAEYIRPGKTLVFLGSSGVGKSSLLNALAGKAVMKVNTIREDDAKGRHTTTHRQLILLESGVMVIDTPGMRELGLWDVGGGLGEMYADIEELFTRCRFSDCGHQSEPGCAVRKALEDGTLSLERWESYLKLQKEDAYTGDRAAYLRGKEQWGKSIARYIRQQKQEGKQ